MDLGLHGKIAAVAAASSGLGRAVAAALFEEGASVAIASRSAERLADAARWIEEHARRVAGAQHPSVFPFAADLASPEGPESFIRAVESRFGRVDVLISNCGGPPRAAAAALSEEDWALAVPLTLLSAVRLARAVLPGMRERRWGRIIFISSTSVKQPIEGLALSNSLRSAVAGYSKTLSDEVAAEGITVNTVAPGSTATARLDEILQARARERGISLDEVRAEMAARIPLRRAGTPEEFAAAVAFLASVRASYITGVVLPVDGGATRSIT